MINLSSSNQPPGTTRVHHKVMSIRNDKHNHVPLALLRAGFIFVFVIVVVLTGIISSNLYLDKINQEKLSANRMMRSWQSKINISVQDSKLINKSENKFLKLVQQGVVGNEHRLSWFEVVQNSVKKIGMPSVKEGISAQSKLMYDNIKRDFPGIDVFKSTMTLNMNMGHEGDLFVLLNNLRKAKGLFAVDECDIQKINRNIPDTINNIKANCELGWYTMRRTGHSTGKHNES